MATGDTVLSQDGVAVRPDGLAVSVTIPWYRSLWLSSVSSIAVRVGGDEIPADTLRVELAGRTYTVAELPQQWDVLWFIQDRLVVGVPLTNPPSSGDVVDLEVTVDLRLPYMQIAPTVYVTNHASDHRHLLAHA